MEMKSFLFCFYQKLTIPLKAIVLTPQRPQGAITPLTPLTP